MILTSNASTVWLEIPHTIQTESWQNCESIVVPGNRWQAYLNQLCLQTLLPWLAEKSDHPPVVDSRVGLPLWELLNGSAVDLGNRRIALIPQEAMGTDELAVPQEWIDNPQWITDYYLAIEVDADDQLLHVWGYATHAQLVAEAEYDSLTRTYQLDGGALIQDMSVFWVMQYLAAEPARSPMSAIPALSPAEAASLVQQLANPALIAIPRLELPVLEWAALLNQAEALQQLGQQRQLQRQLQQPHLPSQSPSSSPTPIASAVVERAAIANLGQWLHNQFESGWRSLEELMAPQPQVAYALRQDEADPGWLRRAKRVASGENEAIVLVIKIRAEADGRTNVWIQALPDSGADSLPEMVQLSALTPTGEVIATVSSSNESRYIQLRRFKSVPGSLFRVQVTFADGPVTEEFTT
jgi:Protein of unknown function (DUF1822)